MPGYHLLVTGQSLNGSLLIKTHGLQVNGMGGLNQGGLCTFFMVYTPVYFTYYKKYRRFS